MSVYRGLLGLRVRQYGGTARDATFTLTGGGGSLGRYHIVYSLSLTCRVHYWGGQPIFP